MECRETEGRGGDMSFRKHEYQINSGTTYATVKTFHYIYIISSTVDLIYHRYVDISTRK